jgi:hypothetical protein
VLSTSVDEGSALSCREQLNVSAAHNIVPANTQPRLPTLIEFLISLVMFVICSLHWVK